MSVNGQAITGLCSPEHFNENPHLVKWKTDLWFSEDPEEQEQARSICLVCPARDACLDAGIKEEYGIWGGTLPLDRGFIPEEI